MFRTSDENGKAIWIGLLKGKFNIPGMEMQTKEGAPDPKSDTVTGNFVSRGKEGDVIVIGRESASGFKLETFKNLFLQELLTLIKKAKTSKCNNQVGF